MSASHFKQKTQKSGEVTDTPDFLEFWIGAEGIHQNADESD